MTNKLKTIGIVSGLAALVGLSQMSTGEQAIATDTYRGYQKLADGNKEMIFENGKSINTSLSKYNDLKIGDKYVIYETPQVIGSRIDSIIPYKKH